MEPQSQTSTHVPLLLGPNQQAGSVPARWYTWCDDVFGRMIARMHFLMRTPHAPVGKLGHLA